MTIRFVSTLTPEDEERLAPALLQVVCGLIDAAPIAYTLRIESATGRVFQRAHVGVSEGPGRHFAPSPTGAGRRARITA